MKKIIILIALAVSSLMAFGASAQTIGELVDLENQIVKKRLVDELNKPATGSIGGPMPSIAAPAGAQPAPMPTADATPAKTEKNEPPKTTAIYGMNDNGVAEYKGIVQWGGASFEVRPGRTIRGYRVETVDKSGTTFIRKTSNGTNRIFAPSIFDTDGVK